MNLYDTPGNCRVGRSSPSTVGNIHILGERLISYVFSLFDLLLIYSRALFLPHILFVLIASWPPPEDGTDDCCSSDESTGTAIDTAALGAPLASIASRPVASPLPENYGQ